MANLRDLTVGIEFENINLATLTALDSAIDEIEDQLQAMGGQLDQATAEFITMGAGASAALSEIQDEANDAASAINDLGNEDGNPDGLLEAIAQLAALEAAANSALDDIDDEADDATGSINLLSLSFVGAAVKAAALGVAGSAALSAIVAAAAPLLMVAGGLGASFVAAGAGVAAYGAVAMPILAGVFEKSTEIAEIEEKIAAADTAKERAAAQKELAAAMEGVSKEQQFAMDELAMFKEFWAGFTKQFESPVFEAFGFALATLQRIFEGLAPTISNVADVIVSLLESLNQDISNGGMQEFFDWLATNAAEAIRSFAIIGGNLISGFFSILQAFSPIGASIEEGLISLTDKFATWAAGFGSSNGFQQFIAYAQTNGPVLLDILKNVWQIGGDVITALAPLGTIVLDALGLVISKLTEVTPYLSTIVDEAINFGEAVVEHWQPIQTTIVSLAAGVGSFLAIMKGLQIIGIINQLMVAFRAGTVMATLAQWGLNTAMLANPVTWIVAAIAALIAIGVALYMNWDVVKAKALELWAALVSAWNSVKAATAAAWQAVSTAVMNGIQSAWNWVTSTASAIWNGIQTTWNNVKNATVNAWNGVKTGIGNAMDAAKTKVTNFFQPLLNFISSVKGAWDTLVSKLQNFKMPAAISKIGGAIGNLASKVLPGHATGLERVPYDDYVARLHKDEAVLTAGQSNALREAGILSADAQGKPQLRMGGDQGGGGSIGGGSIGGGQVNNTFAPQITIEINGASGDERSIAQAAAQAAKREIEKFWMQMNIKNA